MKMYMYAYNLHETPACRKFYYPCESRFSWLRV